MIATTSLIQANARVDHRQEHIDEQVDADKEQGHRENKALNCGVVGGHQGLDREGSVPGQENTFSTSTFAPSKNEKTMPSVVNTGSAAFRNA